MSLHPCTPRPEDLEHLWRTLCGETPAAIGAETSATATETAGGGTAAAGSPRRDYLSWFDFLHGMARVCHDPRAARLMDLNRPNEWALISLLIDVKFSAEEVCPPRKTKRDTQALLWKKTPYAHHHAQGVVTLLVLDIVFLTRRIDAFVQTGSGQKRCIE